MVSLLSALLICWSSITFVLVGLLIYRSLVAMKEEDGMFLDPAEWQLQREQQSILTRLNRITPFVRGLAIVSTALLVLIAGVWIYRNVLEISTLRP